jgi:hypothetical protein
MPSVVACQPDGVAVADLRGTGRIGLAGVVWQGAPAFALVWRYPPSPAFLMGPQGPISLAAYSLTSLVRAPMAVAQKDEEIQRVAEAAMQGRTAEAATTRLAEAMELFKNLPRVRAEVLASCSTDAQAILGAYWQLREWLVAGATERREFDVCDHHLVLHP